MRISKKLYTTLIITVLTLSTLMAAMPMASAITNGPPLLRNPITKVPVTSGPVGTSVEVFGNTTDGTASAFSTVTLYWDTLAGEVLGSTAANINGEWDVDVTIPSAVNGLHYIVAKDDGAAQGAPFNVTASLSASTSPPTADATYDAKVLPGDSLTLTGHGFSEEEDVTIRFDYNATYNITLGTPAITTNDTGSFSAVVIVPNIAVAEYGDWTVNATDALNATATSDILIDYYITVFPPSGPTGITIWIMGRIPAATAYDIRVDTVSVVTGTSGSDGSYFEMYTLPPLISQGAHTIYIFWQIVNNRSTSFTVTAPPQLTKIDPTSGVAGATVTISGSGFSFFADITLTLGGVTVNSTALDDRFGPTGFGTFTDLEFTVPVLAPGTYYLTVTDEYGASTGNTYTFTVLPTPVTTVALRGTIYYPCCTLSFNIVTTETDIVPIIVTIRDPTGAIWWTTDTWTLSGAVSKSVYYQDQLFKANPMKLPLDAPLGTWNWTVTYTPTSTAIATKASGLFTVAAEPGMQTVIDALNANTTTILDAITDSSADLTALLEALDAKIVAIDGTVATIDTTLGPISTSLQSLDATIKGLDGDIATIQTSVGGVTTSLASIDAVVGSMYGDLVTINTTLGTIEGTIMDMDGTLATIETSLGTVQMDVAAVKTDVDESLPVTVDMMPVWIAAILSLIAAIAAIFAVVTIRQKIAG